MRPTRLAVLDVLHATITLATILMGFTLLKWRERWVDSGWRWLIGLDERLRRPLEVLYLMVGIGLVVLGIYGVVRILAV
jgi:hypothetical protein